MRMPWKSWARRLDWRRCSWEPSHTAAPYRLRHMGTRSCQPPRRTNADPVRRGASKRNTSLRGQATQRGAHKPMANGGIVAEKLLIHGYEPGEPGAHRDRRQLLWVYSSSSAMPPFVRPIASEYPLTVGSREVPQWDRGDDADKCRR
jgi:hypothetical protein